MEGKRGNDLQALTEIADNDVLIVDTGEGTRKITYGALCAAVKNTLGIREVVESTNITEPGFLMDGKTASEAFTELYSKKLVYDDAQAQTLTLGSAGYAKLTKPSNKQYLFATTVRYNGGMAPYGISGPEGGEFYVLGVPNNAVNQIVVRFWRYDD